MNLVPERYQPMRNAIGSLLHAGADVANVVLLFATFWATHKLWIYVQVFLNDAGGLPPDPRLYGCGPSGFSGCHAYGMALWPDLHLRLIYWAAAWIAFVFFVGGSLLCISGLRWAFWRVRGIVITA